MITEAQAPPVIVWIDAEHATIVEWRDGDARLRRIESDVPPHRRSSGHLRHDPAVRHGGGGVGDGEARRLEHVRRFLDEVVEQLPGDGELRIIGPGTMSHRLAGVIEGQDRLHGRTRAVLCIPSERRTDRQLAAELREAVGAPAPRQQPRRG